MKVIQTELEPQVRFAPAAEIQAPTKPLKRRSRVMLTPVAVDTRLFHAL